MTVAMMFCFSATAFAANFSDMDNATDVVKDSVNKAVALEIIEGYEDGTFKPDATITRAEFAKMACIAAGLKSSGEALAGTTPSFSDVKANEWYTGWINLASSKGFVRGYEDGTYKPNQTISNQEIVTVLMRMLGYNDNLTGPWPIDYINQAAKLDVTEDISGFVGAAAATRGNVAVMLDATLDQYMVEYSKDIEDFAEKTKSMQETTYSWVANPDYPDVDPDADKFVQLPNGTTTVERHYTMLEDSFDGFVLEDVKISDWNVKNYDDNTFTLTAADTTFEATLDGTAFSSGDDFFGSIGQMADIFYTVDSKNVKTAKFVDVTSQSIDVEKLTAENGKIKADGKSYNVVSGQTANGLVDGLKEANVYYTIKVNSDNEVFAASTDADGRTDNMNIVEEVKNNKVYYLGKTAATTDLSDDEDYIIIENGAVVGVDAIAAGDVLQDRGNDVYEIKAPKVGKMSRYSSTSVTIDGISYAATNALAIYDGEYDKVDLKDYVGTEVQYAVQGNNSVKVMIANEEGASTTMYGLVTKLSKATTNTGDTDPDGEIDTLTIFNNEGKSVEYDVKSDLASTTGKVGVEVTVGTVIEYKLNADGVIRSINLFEGEDYISQAAGDSVTDDDNNRITIDGAKYTVNDKTIIFNVTEDDGDYEGELMTKADIITGDPLDHSGIVAKVDGARVTVMFINDANATSPDKYGFVEYINNRNADDDYTVKFYGDDKEYVLVDVDGNAITTASSYEVKDFVRYEVSGDEAYIAEDLTADVERTDGTAVTDNEDGLLAAGGRYELTADTVVVEAKYTGKQDAPKLEVTAITTDDIVTDDNVVVYQNDDKEAVTIVKIVDLTVK